MYGWPVATSFLTKSVKSSHQEDAEIPDIYNIHFKKTK